MKQSIGDRYEHLGGKLAVVALDPEWGIHAIVELRHGAGRCDDLTRT
jgi:hypothetical protein